jgi:hypothetical protein
VIASASPLRLCCTEALTALPLSSFVASLRIRIDVEIGFGRFGAAVRRVWLAFP